MSDGDDNASTATFDEVVRKTQASNTVIYAVALLDPLNRDARPEVLQQLARATGGEAFRPATTRSVEDALHRVAQNIRRTYLLGFSPSLTAPPSEADADRHHSLRVVVTTRGRDEWRVRTREGYRRQPPAETTTHAVQ
jgi:VWFA-related protein